MINYKHCSILESECEVLVHQVNCMGVMGKGLAGVIRSKYPKVFEDYRTLCKNTNFSPSLLGKVQFIETGDSIVANLFGQYNYGNYGKYTNDTALRSGLIAVRDYCRGGNKSLAIPNGIGCNLGGGCWDEILPMIKEVFDNEKYEVTICVYK